jgi:uncharacterized protein (TIGR01244 family)
MFKQLDDRTLVCGQLRPDQLGEARRHGVTMIVNNRPDGEEPGQPLSAEIREAAEAVGLEYRHIPISRGIGPSNVEEMRAAIHAAAGGKLLAFCRSGTRSTYAWAVAKREDGCDPAKIQRCAEQAGYDIAPVSHLL